MRKTMGGKKRARRLCGALLCLALIYAMTLCPTDTARAADSEPPAEELTSLVSFLYPRSEQYKKRLADDSTKSYVTLEIDDGLQLSWGDDAPVEKLYLEWFTLPSAAKLELLDANGAVLSSVEAAGKRYNVCYAIDPAARGLRLLSEEALKLCTVRLFTKGALPEPIREWQPPLEKADLLVISAHPDDELLYFGGTIPTYAGEKGNAVQVAYMAYDQRVRVNEASEGLWMLGVRNAPIFMGFRDAYTTDLKSAERRWGHDVTLEAIVKLIRETKPEVVVTHDLGGEYKHGAHMITAACTLEAVAAAADGTLYRDAGKAWQVKKLYLHLYEAGAVTMDWEKPLGAFDGKTALEMANLAYDCHVSQQEYHQNVYAYGDYGSAYFGLAYTCVGQDESKDDFFEHVDPSTLTNYVPPTPSPTPEPTHTPVPTDTPAPTSAPSPAALSPAPDAVPSLLVREPWLVWLLPALAAVAVILLGLALLRYRRLRIRIRKKNRHKN